MLKLWRRRLTEVGPYRENAACERSPVLREHEYLVYVDYAALSSELANKPSFDYRHFNWEKHALCNDIDETPGDCVIRAKPLDHVVEGKEAVLNLLADMDRHAYRPATYIEAYALAKARLDALNGLQLVPFGSVTSYDGNPAIGLLRVDGQRILPDMGPFGGRWSIRDAPVFVRRKEGLPC